MQESQSTTPTDQELKLEIANVVPELPKPELSGHAWVQRGTQLVCQSCTFPHSSAILDEKGLPNPDWQLVGLKEDGTPIFRKLDLKS